jgi:hypothetical protein
VLCFLALVACSDPLRDDVVPFDQLDYKTWKHTEVAGDAPGHAGYRTIYANDLARDASQSFTLGYQEGAILIKEVYNDAARTDLRHTAVMRRIGEAKALEDDGGWYFTEAKAGGAEEHFDFCFRRCHVAAPYNGAWLDYRDGR